MEHSQMHEAISTTQHLSKLYSEKIVLHSMLDVRWEGEFEYRGEFHA